MFRNPLTDVIVVLVIVLLVMGPKRLPGIGKGLGQGMREFKEGITGENKDEKDSSTLTQATAAPTGAAPDRPAQSAATPGTDAGSEPRP